MKNFADSKISEENLKTLWCKRLPQQVQTILFVSKDTLTNLTEMADKIISKRYSTHERELFAIYSAIKHFQYYLESHEFTIFTDHKPLTFAFNPSNKASPRQLRHLDFISQYTTTKQHISGKDNIAADTLSRIDELCLLPKFDYAAIATAQDNDQKLTKLTSLSNYNLKFDKLPVIGPEYMISCEVSTGQP
ncbi:transposon Ty3-G Gag-Pol polyprotein [Trichonephila clavipes]|nr:transposon Ty3-G Gag-Pol polyprotein [Trichonephila clavipes]